MDEQEKLYRLQLQKILDSRELSSAPQVSKFLAYVAEAAFQHRDHLEQVEIADQVLGKRSSFNPVEDASVRRIATLTRQKIEKYYSGAGREDSVLLQLPLRSYIPVFQMRDQQARRSQRPVVLAAAALAVVGLVVGYLYFRGRQTAAAGAIEIATRWGSIENKALDVAGSGILLGPRISENEDVSVRMQFAPEQVYQQAGLMIFQNPDHYVKLGRHFSGRTYWEFGVESRGMYARQPGTWTYDPLGQNNKPVWLMIRRRGSLMRGFTSVDGRDWRQVGDPLELTDPMPDARMGVYGYNGQVEAASAKARFEDLGAGLSFTGQADESVPPDWNIESNCPEPAGARIVGSALEFRFAPRPCIWMFTRPMPSGDWSVTTELDLLPFSGTVAGLVVRGKKGRLRLVRWALNGGSIAAEYPPGNQVSSAPDFPGCPPVMLRLDVRGGVATGSFSRDQINFTRLKAAMPLEELGGDIQAGLTVQLTSWSQAETLPAPRFYYVRRMTSELTAFR